MRVLIIKERSVRHIKTIVTNEKKRGVERLMMYKRNEPHGTRTSYSTPSLSLHHAMRPTRMLLGPRQLSQPCDYSHVDRQPFSCLRYYSFLPDSLSFFRLYYCPDGQGQRPLVPRYGCGSSPARLPVSSSDPDGSPLEPACRTPSKSR